MKDHDPNQAGLLLELTEGTWNVCRLLADLALDMGDTDLAAGWTWLAEHRKRPFLVLDVTTPWRWISPTLSDDIDPYYQDWLPREVLMILNGQKDDIYFHAETEATAFRAAARAVGEWLRQGGGKS